jgi:CMP/dCMP kinase
MVIGKNRGSQVDENRAGGNRSFVIAIDGPAGSGKSTVAAEVAARLDAVLFDTGAVYRALTLAALDGGVDPSDGDALTFLATELPLRIGAPSASDGRQYDVWIGERDITWDVRDASVERAVSEVSAHPGVREALLDLQRNIGRAGRVVMSGRDVGTVVMPDADLKIWLDASLGERAERRQRQLAEQGVRRAIDELRAEIAARDGYDGSRATAPMVPAQDAVILNTDGYSVSDVVSTILRLAAERGLVEQPTKSAER